MDPETLNGGQESMDHWGKTISFIYFRYLTEGMKLDCQDVLGDWYSMFISLGPVLGDLLDNNS